MMSPAEGNNEGSAVNIEPGWFSALEELFSSEDFRQLKSFLLQERSKFRIYPKGQDLFKAFELTPFDQVKVVMLGQDPYHGPGQAHGLCFSVRDSVPFPPSLRNIFKEMVNEFGGSMPGSGDLSYLARQGVLLLNATLTVREGDAGSHQGRGWERFTDEAIRALSNEHDGLVFLLWGRYARMKKELIDLEKHYVLETVHPSPLSASKGFFGCGHFNEANDILTAAGKTPINWLNI